MQLVIKYSFISIVAVIGLIFSFLLYKENLGNKKKQYQTSGVVLIITYYFVLYTNKRISNDIINIKEVIGFLLIVMIAMTVILKYYFGAEKLKGKKIDLIVNIAFPAITIILFLINIWIK